MWDEWRRRDASVGDPSTRLAHVIIIIIVASRRQECDLRYNVYFLYCVSVCVCVCVYIWTRAVNDFTVKR